MTLPTPGDVHVNTPLSNISVAFMQSLERFVADKVFPNIPVAKQSDRYYTYDRGYFNRDEMEVRAPGTETKGGEYSVDNTPTYFSPVYGFHHDVPDQRRSNADSVIQVDREATELCTMKAMIKREKLWVAKFFANSLWTTNITGVDSAPGAGQVLRWNDAASNPIEDVRTGMDAVQELTGFRPNTLVVSQKVFSKLIDHPDIIDRIKYGQSGVGRPAVANEQALAAILGVDRVLIAGAIENTAAEGVANVHAFIAGKHALLVYSAPSPGLMTPTGGYTFSWTGYLGASANGSRIKKFRLEQLASDRVEIEMAFDQKLVSADLGYFFNTIIA